MGKNEKSLGKELEKKRVFFLFVSSCLVCLDFQERIYSRESSTSCDIQGNVRHFFKSF